MGVLFLERVAEVLGVVEELHLPDQEEHKGNIVMDMLESTILLTLLIT